MGRKGLGACWVSGRRRLAILLAGLFVLAVPLVAAAVSVRLSTDGGATWVQCDDGNLSCDANPAPGVVTFIGAVGPFTVNVTTAITEPVLGSLSFAILDLNSVNVSGGPGTLLIQASHTGYTGPLPGGIYPAALAVGGTAPPGGTAQFWAYLDDANTLFGKGSLLASFGPFGPGGYSGNATGAASATAPFALTLEAKIAHSRAGNSSFDFEVRPRVAEPGMLSLFGIGLGSVLVGGRRRASRVG
ncbi:MAG: hypothetical protein N0A24_06840 [Armatimonadetes bacterium]|nr:hypothetical protein [Armatimonadota bacterium]MDW8153919.1 hypothetical protein [Armatimonadota bacterium]